VTRREPSLGGWREDLENEREGTSVTEDYLPDVYVRLRERFPQVAEAVDALGQATAAAGPLDESTQRLVKLGIAIGGVSEGAVRSNARRALEAGVSKAEIRHVAALAISTRGFPAAVAAFSWIEEVLSGEP
jgi:alkylhydroperoxidase/carboxymuconolactone decarboxylase family protein YurZ